MKVFKKIVCTAAVLLTASGIFAQPGSYREKQNAEYKKLSESTQKAYSTPTPSTGSSTYKSSPNSGDNTRSSGSATSSGSNRQEVPVIYTEKQRQADRIEQAKADDIERKRQNAVRAENEKKSIEYEKEHQKWLENKIEEKNVFVQEGMIRDAAKKIDKRDLKEYQLDKLFYENTKLYAIDRTDAEAAYEIFKRQAANTPYDTMYNRIWRMRVFPFTASECLRELKQTYPDKVNDNELLELKLLPYYFGAVRPNVYKGCNYTIYFPTPHVLDADNDMSVRRNILLRFIELDKKYPREGALAAGFCRAESNPYALYAGWAHPDSVLETYHLKTLFRPVAQWGRDFEGYPSHDGSPVFMPNLVEIQIGNAARWLVNHRNDILANFSKEDWVTIARAQHIHPYYLLEIFKTEKSDRVLRQRYPNLDKACKKFTF